MADMEDEVIASRFGRWLKVVGLSLGLVVLMGIAAGFLVAHTREGGGFGLFPFLFLSGLALAALGCGWLLLRATSAATGEEPLSPKERLNRNILIACGFIGGIMGMVMAVGAGNLENGGGVFSSDPLPTGLAVAMVFVIGVLLPVISIFWHRTIDEQETDAYKTGALYAFYIYGIGAPLWWIAWRGGFAPEPDGIIIYFATILTLGITWMVKKYR